jgi:hypothetical protein
VRRVQGADEHVPRRSPRSSPGNNEGPRSLAGERRQLLSWPLPAEAAELSAWHHLNRVRHGLKVEACYCSLFDECWLTKASADLPRPVASCDFGDRTTYQG